MSKRRAKNWSASAALLFAALGDQTRLELLQRLSDAGPASISILAETFSMTRQGVTKHLNVLAEAGVIEGRRAGREHLWALNPERLAEGLAWLEVIGRGWDDALARLKRHLEE
ncbi:MAG TPA: metalloregulator ArsR/SmtB family transcription factor [Thermoanaerobaculia bacterium]|jgi:DNA-binding transcriptional ArsR family regulator|nr:metalloregulator ArsR/SmtB family transcription factor [Thermoanaerobaculia bacterium]